MRFTRLWSAGPFVTAVGGTTGVNPEVAASLSGGGFSNYFTRPSYQDVAVSSYLTRIDGQYAGLFKCVYWLRQLRSRIADGYIVREAGRTRTSPHKR
jgi:hypothetical protein